MKNVIVFLGFVAFGVLRGQDFTGAVLSGVSSGAGYLAGKSLENLSPWAPLVGAISAPLVFHSLSSYYSEKSERERLRAYMEGRNYERWLQSSKDWYASTLDPYTGRPPAFSGLLYMDDGMPKLKSSRKETPVIRVVLPAEVQNGTARTEREVLFPLLP